MRQRKGPHGGGAECDQRLRVTDYHPVDNDSWRWCRAVAGAQNIRALAVSSNDDNVWSLAARIEFRDKLKGLANRPIFGFRAVWWTSS
jgi:hypothetical protein